MIINKSIIKIYDFIDYIINRTIMLFKFYKLTFQKQLLCRRINTILVVRLGSLGDVVRSTIVISLLKAKHPLAKIDMLTSIDVLPVFESNRDINCIYTPVELSSLHAYDWIINLQAPDPPANFLAGTTLDYPSFVRYISENIPHQFMTGRRFEGGIEYHQTNIQYCRTEVEEILLTALFRFDEHKQQMSKVIPNTGSVKEHVLKTFGGGGWIKPPVGLFFGTSNIIDRGSRSFSMKYLVKLIDQLSLNYSIIIFGHSNTRSLQDIELYKNEIATRSDVIDMVDKTNLEELIVTISLMEVIVSTDSSPIHLAMALNVPVVGLYSNSSRFRVSPLKLTRYYALIDTFEPCFKYTYRWKFFCTACKQKHSEAYMCNQKDVVNTIELIPITSIVKSVNDLFNMNK